MNIFMGERGGDQTHTYHVREAGEHTYESVEQAVKKGEKKSELRGLPFGGFFASYFESENKKFAQLWLVNSSTQFAYDLPALSVYTNVQSQFFDTAGFDSVAARSTGDLAFQHFGSDETTELPLPGGIDVLPLWPFPMELGPDAYVLLTGVARPILGLDTFGAPVEFSVAARAAEPSAFALFTLGAAAMSVLRLRVHRLRRVTGSKA